MHEVQINSMFVLGEIQLVTMITRVYDTESEWCIDTCVSSQSIPHSAVLPLSSVSKSGKQWTNNNMCSASDAIN